MAREFSGEDGTDLAHSRLDERMSDPTHFGDAAGALDFLGGDSARAQIVENSPAGVSAQLMASEQPGDQIR